MKTKKPMKSALSSKRGRKKTGKVIRSQRVTFSMTPEDAEWLNEFAEDCGFISRSQLLTAVLERLRLCGFSPIGSLRMASQICEKLDRNLKANGKKRPRPLDWDSLLLRPLPPLPEDAPFDPQVERDAIEELTKKHKTKTT